MSFTRRKRPNPWPDIVRIARTRAGRAAAVVVATFAVGYTIAATWLFPSSPDPVDRRFTRVPSLIGMPLAEARSRVEELGFTPVAGARLRHPEAAEGTVVAQSPLPGQFAHARDTVTLATSAGVPVRTVPDLVGLGGAEATRLLRRLGFEVQVVRARDPGGRAGAIETRPPAGTRVSLPAPIELVLGEGSAIVLVPDLRGRHVDDVEDLLQQAELQLGAVRYQVDAEEGPGRVVSQSPAPGASLRSTGFVSVVVSGPPPDSLSRDVTEQVPSARRDTTERNLERAP